MAPVNNHPIGKVFIVYGTVKAVSPAGVERILTPNSPIYAHERIVTGPDGSISVALTDQQGHLDLGRMSDVLLDGDVYGAGGHEGTTDAVAQVEDIQAALQDENFDPTTDLPATAAGAGVSGAGAGARGGGRQVVIFSADQMEVLPDSGAETRGVSLNFLDPPPGGNPEEEIASALNDNPTFLLSPAVATVQEDALGTSYGDPDSDATIGNPADVVNPTDIQTLDLAKLVTVDFGNDGPGSISFSVIDPGGAVATGLTSGGQQIYYILNQSTGEIEGRAGDSAESAIRVVFTVSVGSNGQVVFNLDDRLDHLGDHGTNLPITDLGQYIQVVATDSGGDTTASTFAGLVTINVIDDVPVLITTSDRITVDEDGLAGANADAGRAGEVSGTGLATATGNLADNFNFGADGAAAQAIYSVNGIMANALGHIVLATSIYTLDVTAATGAYTFTLHENLLHDSIQGENLQALLANGVELTVVAQDADGDQVAGAITLNVDVLDDVPVANGAQHAILVNEAGNSVDGDLGFAFGADGPAQHTSALQLLDKDGNSLSGYVVGNDGIHLTSGGENLVYVDDGAGGVKAVVEGTDHVVFTVSVDPHTGTYSVALSNEYALDSTLSKDLFTSEGSDIPHQSASFNISDDLTIVATAQWVGGGGGVQSMVQWDEHGIGVNSNPSYESNQINYGEELTLQFQDSQGHAQSVNDFSFTLSNLDGVDGRSGFIPDVASYTLYYQGAEVYTGTVEGKEGGNGIVTVNLHDVTDVTFDTIVFGVDGDKGSYQIQSVTVGNVDHAVTYDVVATDGDGDTASTTFDVTFDADGNIHGSDANEVIAGGAGADNIDGGGGDDVIYGQGGDDVIRGGDGDDKIDGGAGHDHITGGAGADTFIDLEAGAGEVHDQTPLDHLVGSIGQHP